MNHLSHLFLTKDHPKYAFGNFIGDMVSPKEVRSLPATMQQGIEIHYFIDRTVDDHVLYKECINLLKPSQGKYAPVVMDVFADFLLVSSWQAFYQEDYLLFKNSTYRLLAEELNLIPEQPIARRVQNMIDRDFLESYASKENIPFVFEFLKKRAKFENGFEIAQQVYHSYYENLIEKFVPVFSDLMYEVNKRITQ